MKFKHRKMRWKWSASVSGHIGSVIQSIEKCQDRNLKKTVAAVKENGCKSSMIPLFDNTDAILSAMAFYQPDIIHFCDTLPIEGDIDRQMSKIVDQQTFFEISFRTFVSCDPSPSAPPVPVPLSRHCDGHPCWSRSVIIS